MIQLVTSAGFWQCYRALSRDVQRLAGEAFERLKADPGHPGVRFKAVGSYWSARVGLRHRALAVRDGDVCVWFWIGPHDQYERLIRRG
jgi:hypothetical protein